MTVKEYLDLCCGVDEYNEVDTSQISEEKKQKIKEYNKSLCEEYPFLIPTNKFSGMRITEAGSGGYWPGSPDSIPEYDYEYTEMDSMPDGWRIAFGDDLLKELKSELIKFDFLEDYRIEQIKEKFGGLRWYDSGTPIGKLSNDYIEYVCKYGDPIPKYDWKNYVMKHVSTEHYINPFFDDFPEGMTKEDVKEYNKGMIRTYRLYKIIDKCKINDILRKYEEMSYRTCIICGKPAEYITEGWISPFCGDCIKKVNSNYHKINKEDILVWETL